MAREFDIDRLIAEQSGNLGSPGNRNPVNASETERIINETRNGNANLVVTPSGSIGSTDEETIKRLIDENPKMVLTMLQDKKISF